jgi:hypothetical protein
MLDEAELALFNAVQRGEAPAITFWPTARGCDERALTEPM